MQHSEDALYRAAQIREAERIAIQELEIPGIQLMRNAGQTAFTELCRRWPDIRQVQVFCGGGNNGGDGYVVARLALQAGFSVSVYAIGVIGALKGDALTSYQDFIAAGGCITAFDTDSCLQGVIVDALLGTGLDRAVGDRYAEAIFAINKADGPVMAVDVPSGLHADSGCILGCAVKADLTVTFIGLKCGLFTGDAADYCGEIVCADLDVPATVFDFVEPSARLLRKTPLSPRPRCAHKGHFGHVLLVGGNLGYSGAIRLAAEAALRSGAGLVSVATRTEHSVLLNIGRPEMMCHGVETPDHLQALLDKAGVVVIGPGLGQDAWSQAMLSTVLASGKNCVVDADALNLLVKSPQRRANWILTPHPGEAARLLNVTTKEIANDRYAAVAKLQDHYGGVCVLKGAGSLIADHQGIHVASNGNPGMASGGMGDVLAGIAGGLWGQSVSQSDAAKLAVFVHGEAADAIATDHGERGLLASDLLPKIRELLNP